MKSYCADREKSGRKVFVREGTKAHENIVELSPERSFEVIRHSPDGFEWGYSGSGPAQLALGILLDVFAAEPEGQDIARAHYQDFKSRFIANLPIDKWLLREDDVRQWVANATNGMLV